MFFAFVSINAFVTTFERISIKIADFYNTRQYFAKNVFTNPVAHTHGVIIHSSRP